MSVESKEVLSYKDLLDMDAEEFARFQEMIKDGQWKDTGFVPLDGELFKRTPANRKRIPEGMITWEKGVPGRRCYFFQEAHGHRYSAWHTDCIPLEVMEQIIKIEKAARDEERYKVD